MSRRESNRKKDSTHDERTEKRHDERDERHAERKSRRTNQQSNNSNNNNNNGRNVTKKPNSSNNNNSVWSSAFGHCLNGLHQEPNGTETNSRTSRRQRPTVNRSKQCNNNDNKNITNHSSTGSILPQLLVASMASSLVTAGAIACLHHCGIDWFRGPTGHRGHEGVCHSVPGPTGAKGESITGPTGPGYTGPTGQSFTGPSGGIGPTGQSSTGPTGNAGPTGLPGKSCECENKRLVSVCTPTPPINCPSPIIITSPCIQTTPCTVKMNNNNNNNSNGSCPMVPDVVGQRQSDAQGELEAFGFYVTIVSVIDPSHLGQVISQSPSAGAAVAVGANVTITVGRRAPMTTVPNVVFQTQAAAQSILHDSAFSVTTSYVNNPHHVGHVISQMPIGNTNALTGSNVNITVGMT